MSSDHYFQHNYIPISFAIQGAFLTADIVGGWGRDTKGRSVHAFLTLKGQDEADDTKNLVHSSHCSLSDIAHGFVWRGYSVLGEVWGRFGDSQFFWNCRSTTLHMSGQWRTLENCDVEYKSDLELRWGSSIDHHWERTYSIEIKIFLS